MERNLERMAGRRYDLLVIGGGINGTAILRDAALRGLRAALVEGEDFGWGTTARSTRLIHGGLRYLEHFEFGLVREGLREREILLRTAGHLVRPLPFLTPLYAHSRVGPIKLKMGMLLYDLLSWGKSLPSHRWYDKGTTLRLEPGLTERGLAGAMLYYDGQVELPERLCLENLLQAVQHGADVANYAPVRELVLEGRAVKGAVVEDALTGARYTLFARVVVNATGPWVDLFSSRMLKPGSNRMRLTKGTHILLPPFVNHAIVILAESDGRLFFALPWRGYTLVGTTDTDFEGDPGRVRPSGDEIEYLLRETRRIFPRAPLGPVYWATAGVRPLARDGAGDAGATSRRHRIVDHREEGYEGILSVLGGKITNQRFVAEETVDIAAKMLRTPARSVTARRPYYGAVSGDFERFVERAAAEHTGSFGLTEAQVRRLARTYAGALPRLLDRIRKEPRLARPLVDGHPATLVEVHYGVEVEMVQRTQDFLLRRTGLGLDADLALELAPRVADAIGALRGWDRRRVEQDVEDYLAAIEPMRVDEAAWRALEADQGK